MFNLEETFDLSLTYSNQKDFYLRGIFYFLGVITFLEMIRSQLAEVNLLQLIPGYYYYIFFFSFLFLIFFSTILIQILPIIDKSKYFGTKLYEKIDLITKSKISFSLVFIIISLVLNSLIPISFDSFSSSGEKTIGNSWSFENLINLEIILLLFLIGISQLPLFLGPIFKIELEVFKLFKYWRLITFLIILESGFLTPTLDGYTQLSFAFCTFCFYIILVNLLQKRIRFRTAFNCSLF